MFVFLLVLAAIAIHYFLKLRYQYWEKKGVVGPKPSFLVGNLGRSFVLKALPGEVYAEIYNQFQNEEMVGIYRALTPVLLIRSPDLIKEITVKSFNNFRDNDWSMSKKDDSLFGRNPFVLKGEEWKTVRGQLTSGFTSGKMKWLYPYLEDNSKKLIEHIANLPEESCEVKEICKRFTLNNIASCVFGIEGKCFEEEESEFWQLGEDFFAPAYNFFLLTLSPFLAKLLSISFCRKGIDRRFLDLVKQTFEYREEKNVVCNDYLQVLGQLKKTRFTDEDVAAHCAGFFLDGFETSSIAMSFALLEIASNFEAQKKLREEILQVFEENDTLGFEILQNLPYLDAVLNEALRMHPPLFNLQKVCTEDFTCTSKNSTKSVTIEKGTPVIIPIYGIQNDPAFFDNPEIFKPERFLGEEKDNLKKYTFLPFGEGPRICLGKRFATLQIKVGIAHIVQNYELSVNEKTELPIRIDPVNILVQPEGGLWIDFKKIQNV